MTTLSAEVTLHREGRTEFYVPTASLRNSQPPRAPAFFNPYAALNRDISVGLYEALRSTLPPDGPIVDLLAGVGARGLRLANETTGDQPICVNDANPRAIHLARQSHARLRLKRRIDITAEDGHRLLACTDRASAVDIDPFGSPAPFLLTALAHLAPGGVLAATATDTATLHGHYPWIAQHRYGGTATRTEYGRDTGLRLLLAAIARLAADHRLIIAPLFAHVTRHYFRVYVRVEIMRPTRIRPPLGYVHHCPACGHRQPAEQREASCPFCHRPCQAAGPLWLDALYDPTLVAQARAIAAAQGLCTAARLFGRAVTEDSRIPTYYTADNLAQRGKHPTVAPATIIARLQQIGYPATQSALDPQAIRTPAPLPEVLRVLAPLHVAVRTR